MKMIGIVRVSTDEQAGANGEGLARQRESVNQIARVVGADLQTVEVIGVSGSDLADTVEWATAILPAVEAGAAVAADAIDRIVRADGFDLRCLMAFRKAQARIYLPGTVYNTMDPRDVFTMTLFAGLGGMEKSEIKRRMMGGKEAKRRAGCWVNRVSSLPLGTSYDRTTRAWGYTGRITDVQEAFSLFVHDGLSLASVARRLHLRGSAASAKAILTNPIYKGWLIFDERRGEKYASKGGKQADRRRVARDPDDVIRVRVYSADVQAVSDSLWDAAQGRIRQVKQSCSKRRERTAPGMFLSGFLFSAYEWMVKSGFQAMRPAPMVKHVIYGESGGRDRPTRYSCRCKGDLGTDPNAPRPRCDLHYLHAAPVNQAIDEYLRATTNTGRVIEMIRAAKDDRNAENKARDADKARLSVALRKLDTREANAKDMREDGTYSPDEFRTRLEKIRAERAAVEVDIARVQETAPVLTDADVDRLAREWTYNPEWTPDRKRAWLGQYVKGITISNVGVESIVLRIPGAAGSGAVFYVPEDPWPWAELVGYDLSRPEDRLAGAGRFVAGQVADRLRITVPRLTYLVRCGVFPAPTGEAWGLKKTWTEPDVSTYRKILPTIKDRRFKAHKKAA